ncbi:MAG: hypothetical protein K6E59_02590 [Bacilli bacterium]|nr:hypothetical protein [Bacilli bacterium]
MLKRNTNTRKPAKGLLRSLFVGMTALLAIASGSLLSTSAIGVSADGDQWVPPEEETLVEHSELAVTAVSSTLTSSTQSFAVSFRSKKIEGWANGARYSNVYSLPDDPTWTKEEAFRLYAEDKEAAEAEGKEVELRHYDASVYNISYRSTASKIDGRNDRMIIPATVERDQGFILDIVGINQDACFNPKTDLVSYDGIAEIVIPETIKTISDGAFYDVPEGVRILCEAPEYYEDENGDLVKTYPNDWTDITPVYDYELTEEERDALDVLTTAPRAFGKGADFFLGIENEDFGLPLYMEYSLEKTSDGGATYTPIEGTYMHKVPIQSTNNPYDAVGSSMGETDLNQNISVPVPSSCRIDASTVKFHNIFRARPALKEENYSTSMIPDQTEAFYAEPAIAYSIVPHFEEFYSVTPISYSTLGDYLQLEVEFTRQPGDTGYGIYPSLEPKLFAQNRAALDSGKLMVRYQFSSLDQAYYNFTAVDGQTYSRRVSTPVKYVLMPDAKGYRTGFLIHIPDFPGLNAKDIRKVEFSNFGIKADLYNTTTNSIVTKSSVALRFSSLVLFSDLAQAKHIDVGTVIAVVYIAYVVLFAIGAVSYYFFAKKKFRNDEFRRVNDQKYWLNALKNFAGFALILSAILFIYCRWGLLRTTIVTFNPLDAFVALFTVLGAIFLGFTIRDIVVSAQAAKKRKETERLKLDQDVDDDGTH